MNERARAKVERAIELFNRDMGTGQAEPADDTRAAWAPAPVIVPLRAALEGGDFSGPSAIDECPTYASEQDALGALSR